MTLLSSTDAFLSFLTAVTGELSGITSLVASRIDLAVLLFALLIGLIGFFSGAIRQIANILGLLAAYFAARPLGAKISPLFAEMTGLPLFFVTLASCLLAFFAVYGLTYLLMRMVLKRCLPDGERGIVNRIGGLAVGIAKAGLLAFVLLSGLVLIESAVSTLWDRFAEETRISRAYDFARRNSLFARLTQFETLQTVIQASGSRDNPRTIAALEQLASDPRLTALAKDSRISSIALDPAIQKALAHGNYAALFANEKILGVLNDQELFDHLGRVRAGLNGGELPSTGEDRPASARAASGIAADESGDGTSPQRSRAEAIEAMQGE